MPDLTTVDILTKIKQTFLEKEGPRAERTNYYIKQAALAEKEKLPIPRQEVAVDRATILIFADDDPLFNWAHPCRYILFDAKDGSLYRQIPAQFPPAKLGKPEGGYHAFHVSVAWPQTNVYRWRRPFILPKIKTAGNLYAVLFSGVSYHTHVNDMEFLYRTLTEVYRVPKQNIYVLNQDGTVSFDNQAMSDWPGDHTAYRMEVKAQGTKKGLFWALDEVKKNLKAEDSLLIHTTGHGGHDHGESDLSEYQDAGVVKVTEFTDKLAEMPKHHCQKVVMQQCHSGGFNKSVVAKSTADATSIASACTELRASVCGPEFNFFACAWISAMAEATPNGWELPRVPDQDDDGMISAREAFDYASAYCHPTDTPVFCYANGGDDCALGLDIFKRFKLPRSLAEKLIREYWPQSNSGLFAKRLGVVLPELEALAREFGPHLDMVQRDFQDRFTELVQKAANLQ